MPPRRAPASPSLLSPSGYDDDVVSLRSLSDQDTDSEDDELIKGSRSTLELAQHDRTVLEEEEELEKLLVKSSPTDGLRRIFGASSHDNGSSVRIGKKERRRRRRSERRAQRLKESGNTDVEGELMYEMEGGFKDDSSSQASTTSFDSDPGGPLRSAVYTRSRRASCRRFCLIFTAIVVLFLILFLGAYKESVSLRISQPRLNLLSNGTSLFAPTTILISLDGFRADFLSQAPNLKKAIDRGVSPPYMLPSFPSVTFPNHFTLATGLYPESHGVVGNTFWDPALGEDFYYTDPARSMQPKWWTAEPVWVTAENQGARTAIHMWPGSEAHIAGVEPTFLDKFNGSEALFRKVNRITQLLDMPGEEAKDEVPPSQRRPQLILAYVPNVDSDGHKYGPNSTETRTTVTKVDEMIGDIFSKLDSRNLTDVVNVIVVSDHGMATTSTDRLIQLDDLVDLDLVERIDGWPLQGLRPKKPEDLTTLRTQLLESSKPYSDSIEIYTRDTMPERYHFSNNERIAPLWIIPKTGWAMVKKSEFDVEDAKKNSKVYHPRGLHGYDHEHPLMRSIFVARGPKFPHKAGSRVDVFQNTEVYNILCDSLEIKPAPNNGTLHLPLKPVGLHSDPDAPPLEIPPDPPISASMQTHGPSPIPTSSSASPTTTSGPKSTRPAGSEDGEDTDTDDEDKVLGLWDKFRGKIEELKDWASGLFSSDSD
ncbi:hypothetical protein AJ80_07863 [Polytolypa hystricis UAMH7299]|uniref:Ectonucleotide pyrophosphatase/phosphodiesterase family member 1/3 n=1 Tax=Polytolypa hystricis (strain UAMH7299) TaxID=1447883 RepID=A0A2B7X9Z1_POLH7|nr:hypothetical protein AJ80_07863 [Polytolypa hystricis UAMH7299]